MASITWHSAAELALHCLEQHAFSAPGSALGAVQRIETC